MSNKRKIIYFLITSALIISFQNCGVAKLPSLNPNSSSGFSSSKGLVDFAWDANSDGVTTGYKIYYGSQSGNYTQFINVGSNLQATISNLSVPATYYFAVVAYDVDGNESPVSDEVSASF